MSTVKIIGWKPGFEKISHTKIIRKHTGYGLAEGKRCTDDVLEGKEVTIPNLTEQAAQQLLEEITEIGAVAVIDLETLLDPTIQAHKYSSSHRAEIMTSERCGCFFCMSIFGPGEIKEWTDELEGVGTTAMCPHCGIDSVIGSRSGYPITRDFLIAMHEHWF